MSDGAGGPAEVRSMVVKRNAVPLVAVLVAAALIGLLVYGVAQRADNRTLDEAVAKGQRPVAPSLTLPLLGRPGARSLTSFRGKPGILNFWASWCDPVRPGAPYP